MLTDHSMEFVLQNVRKFSAMQPNCVSTEKSYTNATLSESRDSALPMQQSSLSVKRVQ
jgi:hypothetical protein